MPGKSITMRKIKDVIRLRQQAGLSQREIANALRLSVGVVNKYLSAAAAAELTWPLPDLSDTELRQRFQPRDESPNPASPAQPDFALIHQELKKKGVTRQLLWEEYVAVHPTHHYKYSQYCHHYRQWCKRQKLSMRQTHQAGEKMFVDYAGPTVPLINPKTGETSPAQIFVAVLGASNYTFAEATLSQQLPDWIGSHVRAFEYFGGVPALVVPDNLKSAVSRTDRYEPVLNRTYEEMLEHYGTFAIPTRPRKPKDKPKVEVAVQIVERWILARLRHQRFYSLAELNRSIAILLKDLNQRPFRKRSGTRHSEYLLLDHPALAPLPAEAYQFATWIQARVQMDYHVAVEGHLYSVPYQLVTQQLDVRITPATVHFIHQNRRVALHIRSTDRGQTTLPEHMPPHHRAFSEESLQHYLEWSRTVGPQTNDFVARLISSRPRPTLAIRSCRGLVFLSKRYGPARLEAACQRAIMAGAIRQLSVRLMLEKGLESVPLPVTETDLVCSPQIHENIRGASYYQ